MKILDTCYWLTIYIYLTYKYLSKWRHFIIFLILSTLKIIQKARLMCLFYLNNPGAFKEYYIAIHKRGKMNSLDCCTNRIMFKQKYLPDRFYQEF